MSKIFKCGDCGHISRLSKRQIKHTKDCKRPPGRPGRRRQPDYLTKGATALRALQKALDKGATPKSQPKSVIMVDMAPDPRLNLLTEDQFVAKLLSIKGDKSLHDFAPDLGVSYQFLGHVMKGDYHPGPKVAEAMGYEQVVMFRPGKKPARVPRIDKRQMKLPILEKSNAAAAAK